MDVTVKKLDPQAVLAAALTKLDPTSSEDASTESEPTPSEDA
jgi:hypothetical protein